MKRLMRSFVVAAVLLTALVLAGCETKSSVTKAPGGDTARGLKPGQVGFKEFSIGTEKGVSGITIAPVYFQAVDMEPKEQAGLSSDEGDIHIEADIKAVKNNETGFGFGEFIPYLKVDYKIENAASGEISEGTMMPMNASDGPHYGANVKMGGAGRYKVSYTVESPESAGYLLHADKATGVPGRFWKKPIEASWEFNYVPLNN